MRANPTTHCNQRQPQCQNQPRVGADHQRGNQPHDGEHGYGHPRQGLAGFEWTILLDVG